MLQNHYRLNNNKGNFIFKCLLWWINQYIYTNEDIFNFNYVSKTIFFILCYVVLLSFHNVLEVKFNIQLFEFF